MTLDEIEGETSNKAGEIEDCLSLATCDGDEYEDEDDDAYEDEDKAKDEFSSGKCCGTLAPLPERERFWVRAPVDVKCSLIALIMSIEPCSISSTTAERNSPPDRAAMASAIAHKAYIRAAIRSGCIWLIVESCLNNARNRARRSLAVGAGA